MYEHFSRRPKEVEDAIIASWEPSKVHKNVFSKDETKQLINLFKKAPNQGVQVSALAAAGPSIGLIAPYFIEYALNRVETVVEPYDPTIHQSRFNILGTGQLLEGVGQSKLAIGAMAKAALHFEFGVFKSNATGLEVGYQLEGFQKKIPLIPTAENKQFFQSAYFTLFFGFRK